MSQNTSIKSNLLIVICCAVLCTILTLGLWPFRSPKNQVYWLENRNGIRFGRYGTVASFRVFDGTSGPGSSIEIWLQPRRIWDSGTFLAFYNPTTQRTLSFRQSRTHLLLQQRSPEDRRRRTKLYTDNILQRSGSNFLTITSGPRGIRIYNDGVLATVSSRFRLIPADFYGRLVIGDSPGEPDNWSGQFFGLAIYGRQLNANEVLMHYSTWARTGRPTISLDEYALAVYVFNEHHGAIIRDQTGRGVDLQIPERYQVLDKIVLEPFWSEFSMSRSYMSAVFKNIIGFVPLGFCFYAWWSMILRPKWAAVATIVLGTTVSITIEILQAFLPTRGSGTTDIITNTLGTWIGVALCAMSSAMPARFSRSLPFSISRERSGSSG
jgi:VanZ family protein